MKSEVHIGVAGLGPMGSDLAREVAKHPSAIVTAICDADSEILRNAGDIVSHATPYTNYNVMLDKESLDGVIIATPPRTHLPLAASAFDAGVHVFCEKPMALTVDECDAMIAAAAAAGRALMVGQVFRYIGVYRFVLEMALSGDLGIPMAMRTIRTMNAWNNWARPWRAQRETAGGFLYEINIHELDLVACILGDPTSVTAAGAYLVNTEVDYEDYVSAHLCFSGNRHAMMTSIGFDYIGRNGGEVYLERGTISYDNIAGEVCVGRAGRELERIPYADIGKEWENGVYREMREFVETCLGEHPATIPGEEGLRAVEICQAIYESARTGQRVELPLARSD